MDFNQAVSNNWLSLHIRLREKNTFCLLLYQQNRSPILTLFTSATSPSVPANRSSVKSGSKTAHQPDVRSRTTSPDEMPECIDDIHCRKGFVCDSTSNKKVSVGRCIKAPTLNPSESCPPGLHRVMLSPNISQCQKVCFWGDEVHDCGIHQYCDVETIGTNGYCKVPRCDENGQVCLLLNMYAIIM